MTKEEYLNQKNDLTKKRLDLFKKMHKIDNKIKTLEEDYALEKVPVKKGDRFIVTSKNEEGSLNLKITKIELQDNMTAWIDADIVTAKWHKKRGFYNDNTVTFALYEKNNYEFPSDEWIWKKVEE